MIGSNRRGGWSKMCVFNVSLHTFGVQAVHNVHCICNVYSFHFKPLGHFGLSWTFLCFSGPNHHLWTISEIFEHLEPPWKISNQLGPFWTISEGTHLTKGSADWRVQVDSLFLTFASQFWTILPPFLWISGVAPAIKCDLVTQSLGTTMDAFLENV